MAIRNRNIITSLLLSLITCGVYAIYWAFMVGREAVSVKNEEDGGLLEGILCAMVPFLGFFLAEKKFAAGCADRGIEHENRSVFYLIMGLIVPFVDLCLMQNDLNKLVD
jgi:hypothetical protein